MHKNYINKSVGKRFVDYLVPVNFNVFAKWIVIVYKNSRLSILKIVILYYK